VEIADVQKLLPIDCNCECLTQPDAHPYHIEFYLQKAVLRQSQCSTKQLVDVSVFRSAEHWHNSTCRYIFCRWAATNLGIEQHIEIGRILAICAVKYGHYWTRKAAIRLTCKTRATIRMAGMACQCAGIIIIPRRARVAQSSINTYHEIVAAGHHQYVGYSPTTASTFY
jgi:hypothetical protein